MPEAPKNQQPQQRSAFFHETPQIRPAPVHEGQLQGFQRDQVVGVGDERKERATIAYGQDFMRPYIKEVMATEATENLRSWYTERLAALPDLELTNSSVPQFGWERKFDVQEVTPGTLAQDIQDQIAAQQEPGVIRYVQDPEKRKIHHTLYVAFDSQGQKMVSEVTGAGEEGSAFNVEGILVRKYQMHAGERVRDKDGNSVVVQEWWQPIFEQNTEVVSIWTPQGIKEVAISGFIGLLQDKDGRIAISVEQEPGAHTEKHALVRTPVQSSVTKLNRIAAGEIPTDPLKNVLQSIVPEGKQFLDLLTEPGILITPESEVDEIRPEPLPYADANRLNSRNLAIVFPPLSDEVVAQLTADGKIYMATLDELYVLHKARLLNYHAAGMIFDKAIDKLRNQAA